MKNILVPSDFSVTATHAYRFAIDIARKAHGTIHVLHAIELPVVHESVLAPVMSFEQQFMTDLRDKATAEFELLRMKYPCPDVNVVFKVAFGPISGSIVRYATEQPIDVVVMGSHGATGMRALFIGSNAEKVVRQSPVPVLIAKSYPEKPIRHIVFPNTLETEGQEELVKKVKTLQHFFDATLHVLYINTALNFTSDDENYARLDAFAARYMLNNFTVNVYNERDEEEGIIGFSRRIQGDMIAMGTHGRRGLSRLVNGSVAEDVVNHTDMLVWTAALSPEPVTA